MQFSQLRYVIEIQKTGSISKAAQNLFLSQPNLSRSIKNLEEELGYELLSRGSSGVSFTPAGIEFVKSARSILKQVEQLKQLPDTECRYEFSVINCCLPPVAHAFERLMLEYEQSDCFLFSLTNYNQENAIYHLVRGECTVAFIAEANSQSPKFQQYISSRGLSYSKLCSTPCNIILGPNHPLLLRSEPFDLTWLWDFPFVDYGDHQKSTSRLLDKPELAFVNPKRLIVVDNLYMRAKMISQTHGYGFGPKLPPKDVDLLGWVCIPIPNVFLEFGYLQSKESGLNPLLPHFFDLLSEELEYLDD